MNSETSHDKTKTIRSSYKPNYKLAGPNYFHSIRGFCTEPCLLQVLLYSNCLVLRGETGCRDKWCFSCVRKWSLCLKSCPKLCMSGNRKWWMHESTVHHSPVTLILWHIYAWEGRVWNCFIKMLKQPEKIRTNYLSCYFSKLQRLTQIKQAWHFL